MKNIFNAEAGVKPVHKKEEVTLRNKTVYRFLSCLFALSLAVTYTGCSLGEDDLATGGNTNVAAGTNADGSVTATDYVVTASATETSVAPEGTVTLSASISPSATGVTYSWEQIGSSISTITNGTTANATATLVAANDATYMAHLASKVFDTGAAKDGNLQSDRTGVVPVNNASKSATFRVTATVGTDTYSSVVNVPITYTGLTKPEVSTGLMTVPLGLPVVLHAKTQATAYSWSITPPAGSTTATLSATDKQDTTFTPDVVGIYTVTAPDATTFKVYGSDFSRGFIGGWYKALSSQGIKITDVVTATSGKATLSYKKKTQELTYTAPGDTAAGTAVSVAADGTYTVRSGGTDGTDSTTEYISVTVATSDTVVLPTYDLLDVITINPDGTWYDNDGAPDATCEGCHGVSSAGVNGAIWKNTGHSRTLEQLMETPSKITGECLSCHTLGYNTTAANNGFDDTAGTTDIATIADWDTLKTDNTAIAKQGGVQCENCHGPSPNQDAAMYSMSEKSNGLNIWRVSYSADLCGNCHSEPNGGRVQQWKRSRHAKYTNAVAAAVENAGNSGADAADCARCHTSQGYLKWLKQNTNATTGAIATLDNNILGVDGVTAATVTELTNYGITEAGAHPQTCQTCHNPHDPGFKTGLGTHNVKTRIMDNSPILPAGYSVSDFGYGALCVTCHNTAHGQHDDSATSNDFAAPHHGAQGDIYVGKNAFFVTTGTTAAHANTTMFPDTCAVCHMEMTGAPDDLKASATSTSTTASTNHKFVASKRICTSHHVHTANPYENLVDDTKTKLTTLSSSLGSKVKTAMGSASTITDYYDSTAGTCTAATGTPVTLTAAVDAAVPVRVGEKQGYKLTVGANTYCSKLEDIKVSGTAIYTADNDVVKAGWNYFLVGTANADGEYYQGVHNPGFVRNVLDASIAKLK
ncbi:MAG: cytochrome c family protein [Nitrospinota bacterium]|nr:cytochrome c family protein [Nitrospinota bacterium]